MKKIILTSFALVIATIAITSTLTSSNAHSAGAPNGYTGAPMDNGASTCTSCHGGTSITSTTGVISSDIPGAGFVAGATYNFTITMSGAAAYGFEVSAQTPLSSAAVGTLIANSPTTKISGNYITHNGKIIGTTASWVFQWTAPSTGTTVTIYGGLNYSNNNSSSSGDIIKTTSATYTVNSTSTAIKALENDHSLLSVYPNPTTNFLHINSTEVFSKGCIYAIDGKLVKTLSEDELLSKTILLSNLPAGLYYINVSNGAKNVTAKFTKNN